MDTLASRLDRINMGRRFSPRYLAIAVPTIATVMTVIWTVASVAAWTLQDTFALFR